MVPLCGTSTTVPQPQPEGSSVQEVQLPQHNLIKQWIHAGTLSCTCWRVYMNNNKHSPLHFVYLGKTAYACMMKTGPILVKPFQKATREVSAEKYVTISKVIPLLCLLQCSVRKMNNTLAPHLTAQCRCRFQNSEHNYSLAAATFLDMQFKNFVFSDIGNVEEKVIQRREDLCFGGDKMRVHFHS